MAGLLLDHHHKSSVFISFVIKTVPLAFAPNSSLQT
jgi:hypothetical protein